MSWEPSAAVLIGFGFGLLVSKLLFSRVSRSTRSAILDLQERLSASEKLLADKISDVHFSREKFLRAEHAQRNGAFLQKGLQPALRVFSDPDGQRGNGGREARPTRVLTEALKDCDQTKCPEIEGQPFEQFREYLVREENGQVFRSSPVVKAAPIYIQAQDNVYRLEVVSTSDRQEQGGSVPDSIQNDEEGGVPAFEVAGENEGSKGGLTKTELVGS